MRTQYISGGDKLAIRLSEISAKLSSAKSVKVGFLENAKYPDGTSVAEVAAYQEFGTPNAQFPIPPRPFFRTMVKKESGGWGQVIEALIKKTDYDSKQILDILGQHIKGQLQQSIIDTLDPPLSEVTLMLRSMEAKNPNLRVSKRTVYEAIAKVKAGQVSGVSGTAAKPLIETGHLLNSVDYEVE